MRNRGLVAVLVFVFAVKVVGFAVWLAGRDDGEALPKLPVAVTGERAAMATDGAAYRVGELPALPDTGPAYSLSVGDPVSARTAVAAALGKDADAVSVDGGPGRPWQVSGARDMPVQSEPECPTCAPLPRARGLLSDEAAEQRAREILGRLGVSGGEAEVRATSVSVEVTIRPTVDGLPTRGYEHHLSLGLEGTPIGGYGWLGRPERLGDYPLVDLDGALDRLRQGTGPRTLRAEVHRAEPCPDTAMCAAPEDGAVAVTGVRLGLQLVAGRLVPSFFFDVAEGVGPVVAAVEDRYLKEVQPEPEPEPRPEPDGEACSGTGGAAPSGDQPLTVQVCGPTTAAVGEEVAFEVTASDADAEIIDSGCGGPDVVYGDEGEGVSHSGCMPACVAPLKDGKPGKLARTFRHTYTAPGTYTARFAFQSAFCTKGASRGEGEHSVVVR